MCDGELEIVVISCEFGLVVWVIVVGMWGFVFYVELVFDVVVVIVCYVVYVVIVLVVLNIEWVRLVFEFVYIDVEWVLNYWIDLFGVFVFEKIVVLCDYFGWLLDVDGIDYVLVSLNVVKE